MIINKIGFEHLLGGINNQDFGIDNNNKKCIVDGCSEGINSEVGSKLFIHLFKEGYSIEEIFNKLTDIFNTEEAIKNHLLFTILYIEEQEDKFIVHESGDGVIIKQKHDDSFEYQEIDYSGVPPYYGYNYISKDKLSLYKEGVQFNQHEFSKKEYKAIGIASDGLSYLLKSQYKDKFEDLLRKRKVIPIKRLINMNHNYQYAINTLPKELFIKYVPLDYDPNVNNFKDDITIVI